jgi:hypothetical protein
LVVFVMSLFPFSLRAVLAVSSPMERLKEWRSRAPEFFPYRFQKPNEKGRPTWGRP